MCVQSAEQTAGFVTTSNACSMCIGCRLGNAAIDGYPQQLPLHAFLPIERPHAVDATRFDGELANPSSRERTLSLVLIMLI
jgi:hypothetical protein